MARVRGPLLSFSGSGQLADTMVYSSWKGVDYVRQKVIPANPRTAGQTLTRNTFAWLQNVWKISPAGFQAPWSAAAAGRPLTDRNLWTSHNNGLLREETTLDGIVLSPGAKGGIAGGITITPGDDLLTFAGTPPSPLPSGWSVVKLSGVAMLQQDPQSDEDYEIHYVEDTTTAYSVAMTGLASATAYIAAGFWVYQRSAITTDLAYSQAVGAEYTTT